MLETCDVGHRVVVRRQVGVGQHGKPLLGDLLGELREIDASQLLVRRDDGSDEVVAISDVVAAKRIPPRRPRYSEIIALERVADAAWPAPVREQLGDWLLRAGDGWTNRANSALPLGAAGVSLATAVRACVSWYGQHGLTPRITTPLPVRRDVADSLVAAGWHAQPLVLVQTAALTGPNLAARPAPADQPAVTLLDSPSVDFLSIVSARKTSLPAAAQHVLTAVPLVRFAEIHSPRAGVVAIARAAVIGSWMHLGLVEVSPAARGQGLARAITVALARWAASVGADRAVLQVEEHNQAAVGLYQQLGFATHHTYVTFAHPPGPTAATAAG